MEGMQQSGVHVGGGSLKPHTLDQPVQEIPTIRAVIDDLEVGLNQLAEALGMLEEHLADVLIPTDTDAVSDRLAGRDLPLAPHTASLIGFAERLQGHVTQVHTLRGRANV